MAQKVPENGGFVAEMWWILLIFWKNLVGYLWYFCECPVDLDFGLEGLC
jgi:hypothetical protein